jgi:hypothetical protein
MGASSGFDCIVKVLVIIVVFLFFVGVLYSTCFVVGTAGQFNYWQTCSVKTRLIMIGTDSPDHLNCMNNNKIMHSIRMCCYPTVQVIIVAWIWKCQKCGVVWSHHSCQSNSKVRNHPFQYPPVSMGVQKHLTVLIIIHYSCTAGGTSERPTPI